MEPMNATALYTGDRCDVWCGTQNGEAAFAAVLEVSGLPADKCDVHKLMLGTGFGRRGQTDYVRQAVSIATVTWLYSCAPLGPPAVARTRTA